MTETRIKQIDMQVFKNLGKKDQINQITSKVNEVINALDIGVVHENRVQAERNNIQALANIADVEYRRALKEIVKATEGVESNV